MSSPPRTLLIALALGSVADVSADDRADLTRQALAHEGDPARGRALFADPKGPGCARCHRVGKEGGAVGPDLSDVGGKYGREHLIESVLEPSRQIVEGYRSTVLATADGRVLTGLVRGETADALTLVDPGAKEHIVPKADIEEHKYSDVSIMPDGLSARLSPGAFADLIAYLETLRSAPGPTPGSGIAGPIGVPAGFSIRKVVGGLTGATALAVAPDGRVFVCEQTGTLRVVKGGVLLPEPFVALGVDTHWERGLIGVALDPSFTSDGGVYLNYVAAEPYPHHRISRFTARGDIAAPGSERVLLEGDDQRRLGGPVAGGHQGGALHFGEDGTLYIAIGDQTAGAPAQRLDTLQGKLLRIGPDGAIPADNPFAAEARGKYRAIWALGLRNPFTFAVQPGTGRILINDVGQNAWEEIDEGVAGANYGWPAAEGPSADLRYRPPLYSYKAASIAGGAFVPEGAFPPEYRGKYLFMDFVGGRIWALDPDHPAAASTFATGFPRPVDLAFAPDGSLYVLVCDAWVIDDKFRPHTGALYRVRYEGTGS